MLSSCEEVLRREPVRRDLEHEAGVHEKAPMSEEPFDDEEQPWLREMVDDDLLDLFSDDERVVRRKVRSVIEESEDDPSLEGRLIDLLDAALELGNDDTQASLWATVILGELRSVRALGALLRSLASDEDEALQDAAHVAILRIGAPAVEGLMEAIESEEDPRLNLPGYELLGAIGFLADEALRSRALGFLESRIEAERAHPAGKGSLESVCMALAYLGDRSQIAALRRVLVEDFHGRSAGIREAIEILEENATGEPIQREANPWEERYGWLFEDEGPRHRRRRGGSATDPAEGEGEDRESHLSRLYWGLSATASSGEEPDEDLDARRFLKKPKR